MITFKELLFTTIAPVLATVGVLLVALLCPASETPRRRPSPQSLVLTALALALAFLTAQQGLVGDPAFPPRTSLQIFSFVAILTLPLAALAAFPLNIPASFAARLPITAFIAWLTLRRHIEVQHIPGAKGWLIIAAVAVALAAVGELWARLAQQTPTPSSRPRGKSHAPASGPSFPLVIAAIAGGSAPVLVLAGASLTHAQLAGALAAAITTLALLSFWWRDLPGASATAAVGGLLLPGLWLGAHLYAELHWAYLVALPLAPLASLLADIRPLRAAPGPLRLIIRLAGVGAVVGTCAVIAAMNAPLDDYLHG